MNAKHKFWRVLTRVHKWAALVLGVQIILWFTSGFFMSFFDIENIRGEHVAERIQWPIADVSQIVPPPAVKKQPGYKLYQTRLISVTGAPVYELTSNRDSLEYIDARTGGPWRGASEAHIRGAIDYYYIGDGQVETVVKLTEAPIEYRGDLPVWQVQFADKNNTRLYLSAQTAELKGVRTSLWRVFDFMWMLHIMDYKERSDFNSWWLKLLSFMALLFTLTGVGLLIHRIALRPRPKSRPKSRPKKNT